MAKKSPEQKERLLFNAYLDAHYAAHDYGSLVDEFSDALKGFKKNKKKADKFLKAAHAQYVEVYGREPMKPRS